MPLTVAIHSFRGGTGKSNIAANIAALMALEGKRVGLVDTDIQSPGLHAMFHLTEDAITWALNDFLQSRCSIADVARDVSSALGDDPASSAGKLYLVPARINAFEIARVLNQGYDVDRLNEGFHDLATDLHLDALVLDTHPGLHEATLLTISICDVLVIVLRPDEQDFQGTAVTVEVARQLDTQRMLLALNMVVESMDREGLIEEVAETFGAPVVTAIDHSHELALLGSRDLFCVRQPDHQFSREVGGLLHAIVR
ncbi:MAG: MinD/ParA family protein [Chloroflexi bacterium]|nr:MinD/ParA family protein [Chloroflexota bacterium]